MTPPRYDLRWTRGNLLALTGLCLIAAAGLLLRRADRPVRIARRIGVQQRRVEAGREKINPNLADLASLVRLPRIGPAKAAAIIAYRKAHGPVAFRSAGDLESIKGIGPATVKEIAPHLSLPAGTAAAERTGRRGQ